MWGSISSSLVKIHQAAPEHLANYNLFTTDTYLQLSILFSMDISQQFSTVAWFS